MISLKTKPTQLAATAKKRRGILLVDDHPLFRKGMGQLLDAQPDLQVKAEAENSRKRAAADVAAAHKYALERFAAEIITVRDSLELARTVELPADSSTAVQKMHEGLDLTLKLMDSVFQKFGLTQVDPQGQKFDPERHQAISMVPSAEVPPNHVVNVVQKGYLLNDRLLRPAMVVVAQSPSASEAG